MCCEKCWRDSYNIINGKSQPENYRLLLEKREKENNICTPKEQAGDYWDEKNQCDTRIVKVIIEIKTDSNIRQL